MSGVTISLYLTQDLVSVEHVPNRVQQDPYEKRAFLYLDIISWLTCKIENRSIQDVMKEKALSKAKIIND